MVRPLGDGQLGELFWSTQDAVAVIAGDRVVAWNPAAERIFGVPIDVAVAAGFDLAAVLGLSKSRLAALPDAATGTIEPPGCGPLQVTAWRSADGSETVLLFTDVSPALRIERGLRELNGFAGRLLRQRPSLDDLLGQLSACARTITDADFAAALLVLPGTLTVTHVTVDGDEDDASESSSVIAAALHDSLVAGLSMRVDTGRLPASVDDEEELTTVGPFLAVPIRSGGQTIGMIVVGNRPGGRPLDGTDDSLVTDLAQHAASAIAAVADETRRRQSEDRRRDAIAAARHDIANPLAAGRGYVQILQRRYDDMTPEQRVRALHALSASFERLEEYSHRLLLDERLEVSPPAMRWSDIDIDRFLDELTGDAAAMLDTSAIRVTADRRDGCPRTLAADPDLLREVLDNLLSNAVKFSPQNGDIRIVARRDRRHVRLEVIDTGVGIPLEEQAAVFERHTRTRQSRRDAIPGMGLGLSIVRRIVEAHGGEVGLRSRPGYGTAVWVTFPMECPPFVVESQAVRSPHEGNA